MKRILVFLLFLLLMQHVSAQEPPHLEPVTISEMVPVEIDFDKERQQSGSLFLQPDTNYRFTECRNAEGTVGYLIEAKDCVFLVGMLLGHQFEDCCEVGLQDVQRAETVFAKVMDSRADSAQIIQRAFTAPYFYQYIRQYVFYLNPEGDTCVHINCIHIREVMPEERFFHSRMRPDLRYIVVLDGSDDFWNADLNLTKDKLLTYDVNGPTIHYVDGRNYEPRGLYQKTLFQSWWPIQESYSFEQLPTAVKEAALSQIDKTEITECVYFSTKYIWAYREKKDGSGVSERKRYKKGDYYKIYSDTICHGFDAKGRMVYIGNVKYLGRLEPIYLNRIDGIDTMMAVIERDMSARGRNFGKYGYIQWVEQVGDRYVIAVVYNPPIPADFFCAYYTLDSKGQVEGVTLHQR